MAGAHTEHPTLFEVLTNVHALDSLKTPATDGHQVVPFPLREGSMEIGPDQLLWARIPVQKIKDGDIRGYQRHLRPPKARSFARWMLGNPNYMRELPVIEISITDGRAYITDGQHRAAGAVLANKPIKALLTKRTMDEARRLFANQAKGLKPNRNVLILDGDDPIEEYIQDAVTDPAHPWHQLISSAESVGTKSNRISATGAYGMLRTYVTLDSGAGRNETSRAALSRFDKKAADDLAVLLSAFGTRKTNPLAFSGMALRAIAVTARAVFRDREPADGDRDRWIRHMSRFSFAHYAYLKSSTELAEKLIAWWNKKLPAERRAG